MENYVEKMRERLARSIWREACLVAANAPNFIICRERILQMEKRKRLDELGFNNPKDLETAVIKCVFDDVINCPFLRELLPLIRDATDVLIKLHQINAKEDLVNRENRHLWNLVESNRWLLNSLQEGLLRDGPMPLAQYQMKAEERYGDVVGLLLSMMYQQEVQS